MPPYKRTRGAAHSAVVEEPSNALCHLINCCITVPIRAINNIPKTIMYYMLI